EADADVEWNDGVGRRGEREPERKLDVAGARVLEENVAPECGEGETEGVGVPHARPDAQRGATERPRAGGSDELKLRVSSVGRGELRRLHQLIQGSTAAQCDGGSDEKYDGTKPSGAHVALQC